MSQRTMAAFLALPLLLALLVMVAVQPLPYVTYSPGPTVDILSTRDGEETVQVSGHKAYHDDGELRLSRLVHHGDHFEIERFEVVAYVPTRTPLRPTPTPTPEPVLPAVRLPIMR